MEHKIYFPQNPPLTNLIICFWQTKGFPIHHREIILPKGVVEIVFNFSNSNLINARINDYEIRLPDCFINGFNSKPVELNLSNYQSFFGIRFNPIAIHPLFGINPCELFNQLLDLTLINRHIGILWNQLAILKGFDERCNHFTNWFRKQNLKTNLRDDALKKFLLDDKKTDISITSLSKALMMSSRHLSRKLNALTGMSTEEVLLYRKYLRAQNLLHLTEFSLTEIAYMSDFYDQSHFIKTFKSYTKLTPGQYQRIKSTLPGHIFK